jgi:hypothetical protein
MSSLGTMSRPKGKKGERQREKIIKISSTLMSKYGYNGTITDSGYQFGGPFARAGIS